MTTILAVAATAIAAGVGYVAVVVWRWRVDWTRGML